MANASRRGRSLETVVVSAMIANVCGVGLFVATADAAMHEPRFSVFVVAIGEPALLALFIAVGGYEFLSRVPEWIPSRRPARVTRVSSSRQALVMLLTSTAAGAMIGVMGESLLPTESWTMFLHTLIGAFEGFCLGVVSGLCVWMIGRLSR